MTVIGKKHLKRIKSIHALSRQYNRMVKVRHQDRLLDLMRKHVKEIAVLTDQKDPHGMVETGDLAILCFELLLEGGAAIDDVLTECFGRYECKLGQLIAEEKSRRLKNPRKR